jgi:glycosyltransferase involved in cell wall biosynthesis
MKKIAVVNRYYPPSPASTGDLAHELVHQLQDEMPDSEVFVVTTDAPYKGGWRQELTITERVLKSKALYTGENSVLRFVAGFLEGRALAKLAFSEADVVIAMTNPPLVNYWMGNYARKTGKKYIEWTLDVFPVAFAKAGYVSESSPFYRYFLNKCGELAPDLNLFLGEGQREFVHKAFGFEHDYVLLPCGIKDTPRGPVPAWKSAAGDKTVLGYVGNLGEAHNPQDVIRLVELADPNRVHFVFSMYGAKVESVRQALGERSNISWLENIPDSDLTYMDAHVVTLLPEWTHISVPSKAVSAICMGKPILFMGQSDSDNWRMFGEAGWNIDTILMDDNQIKAVLDGISDASAQKERSNAAKRIAKDLKSLQKATIEHLSTWIRVNT